MYSYLPEFDTLSCCCCCCCCLPLPFASKSFPPEAWWCAAAAAAAAAAAGLKPAAAAAACNEGWGRKLVGEKREDIGLENNIFIIILCTKICKIYIYLRFVEVMGKV